MSFLNEKVMETEKSIERRNDNECCRNWNLLTCINYLKYSWTWHFIFETFNEKSYKNVMTPKTLLHFISALTQKKLRAKLLPRTKTNPNMSCIYTTIQQVKLVLSSCVPHMLIFSLLFFLLQISFHNQLFWTFFFLENEIAR